MKRSFTAYNPKLKPLARALRRNSTLAEILLWKELKGKKMLGYDFHRQKPIGEYIVDFFCPGLMLAIEIDGISHEGKYLEDKKRQEKLEARGIRFLRFQDDEVKRNLESVVLTIREWILEHAQTHT